MVTLPLGNTPEKTHEAVLLHLKRTGEMTVSELCEVLGITSMAVRRHLGKLEHDGLIESRLVRQTRGRPTYRYKLSQKAESLFPTGFQNLALDILDVIHEQQGPKGVLEVLERRNQKRAENLRGRMDGKSIAERVKEVAEIFSEDGYMTDWEKLPDGNFVIYQRHCAVHDLANRYRQVCALEPKLMESLIGVKITRTKYMLGNDSVCGYIVHATKTLEENNDQLAALKT